MNIEGFDYRALAGAMESAGVLDTPFREMSKEEVDAVIEAVRRCLPRDNFELDEVPF